MILEQGYYRIYPKYINFQMTHTPYWNKTIWDISTINQVTDDTHLILTRAIWEHFHNKSVGI